MSRFDDVDIDAETARALASDAETALSRTLSTGGAPPMTRTQAVKATQAVSPRQHKSKRKHAPIETDADAEMSFPVRLYITVDENDPLGKALAERIKLLPENMREHYSTNKVVRAAILQSLGDIAKKI